MTPFAQLQFLDKQAAVAAPPAGYEYAKTESGLNDPFAAYRPTAATTAKSAPTFGMPLAAELGADLALGSNPVTGVPWFAAKAMNDAYNGRWGSAAANVGWGALSFLPGATTVAKAGVGAGRLASAANKANKALAAVNKYTPTAVKSLQTGDKLSQPVRTGILAGGTAVGLDGGAAMPSGPAPITTNPNAYSADNA